MNEMNYEYLAQIKNAAKEGAKEGAFEGMGKIKINNKRGSGFSVFTFLVFVAVFFLAGKVYFSVNELKDEMGREESACEHDLVIEDTGILGYTAADFSDAILGNQHKLCKIEVLSQEVSDVATLLDTGLFEFKIFSKSQVITYHGEAVYTVDLSDLSKTDFVLDEDKNELTVYIPHTELEPINIQSMDIEFGDVKKGFLAFGDIDATPEQIAQVQTKAQEMMYSKLENNKTSDTADRFAKMAVWEMYQPIVNSVAKGYSLIVEFR